MERIRLTKVGPLVERRSEEESDEEDFGGNSDVEARELERIDKRKRRSVQKETDLDAKALIEDMDEVEDVEESEAAGDDRDRCPAEPVVHTMAEETCENGNVHYQLQVSTPSWIELKKWRAQMESIEIASLSIHQVRLLT